MGEDYPQQEKPEERKKEENSRLQKKPEKKITAGQRPAQGRVSIKGKIAEIQEKNGSQQSVQKPSAARKRQKEACL